VTAWSLQRRVTVAIVGLAALVLAGFAWAASTAMTHAARRQHDNGLRQRARGLAAQAEYDDDGYEFELPPTSDGAHAVYLEVWRPDGSMLAKSSTLADRDLPRSPAPDAMQFHDLRLPDGRVGRMITIRFLPRDEDHLGTASQVVLALAEDTDDVERAISEVRRWCIGLAGLALIVIAAVTAWLVGRGLAPLRRLGTQLEAIDSGRLATRVVIEHPPHELAAPIAKLNRLLDRLDASFARERQFTADVSHEMRTPLAGLRTLLEVTALTATDGGHYRAAITKGLAIVADMTALVDNLLTLARVDGGQIDAKREPLSLRPLVDSMWTGYAAQAAVRAVRFDNRVGDAVIVCSDRDLLRVIIGNLLANAAEYTETGGWIEVSAGVDGAILDVVDSGPPISDAARERVFDRMWRGDCARTDSTHCGIGLALARSLATALGYTVALDHRADGAVRFRITAAGP
jgi:signal transduction histidine kinase